MGDSATTLLSSPPAGWSYLFVSSGFSARFARGDSVPGDSLMCPSVAASSGSAVGWSRLFLVLVFVLCISGLVRFINNDYILNRKILENKFY